MNFFRYATLTDQLLFETHRPTDQYMWKYNLRRSVNVKIITIWDTYQVATFFKQGIIKSPVCGNSQCAVIPWQGWSNYLGNS